MDLPVLGVVRGIWHIRDFPQYIGSVDLRGKTVLDVGTASGFLSFEAERAGAGQVVSFDADSAERMYRLPFAENLYWTDWPAWVKENASGSLDSLKKSYRVAHGLLGSKAQTCYGDIFHLRTLFARTFDVTIAGAILEHLNDPVSALANMAMVTRERLIIAFTPIIESEEIMLRAATPDDRSGLAISRGGLAREACTARFLKTWASRSSALCHPLHSSSRKASRKHAAPLLLAGATLESLT